MFLLLCIVLIICCILRIVKEKILIPNIYSKAIFITGCDTGFGRLLVKRLLNTGVTVFAGFYTAKGENDVKAENDYSENLFTLRVDVSDDESVSEAYKYILRTLQIRTQRLWAIVNNAGIFAAYGPDDWLSTEEYKQSLNVNFLGSVRMCHQFIPLLKESRGRIVTMASVSGRIHSLYTAPYTAAKFALEGYMDCLRLELHQYAVSVHIIEPGAFRTTLLDEKAFNKRVDTVWNRLPINIQAEYGAHYLNNLKVAWNSGASMVASQSFNYVIDSYMHALLGLFPRDRYICGWDARLLWQPMSILPSVVQDYILHFLYRLQPGPNLTPEVLRRKTPKPHNILANLSIGEKLVEFGRFQTNIVSMLGKVPTDNTLPSDNSQTNPTFYLDLFYAVWQYYVLNNEYPRGYRCCNSYRTSGLDWYS